ncbi:potassium channel subfamily K member 17-like [Acipenser oxyrinchus oxyrinchus]|uniref:Potassium channel subfamily K member 17-like n=1 Tax=Acipenser oxyrinchus oxyrinchus TaxID=40147 RepID=A0AAD8LQK0_ACIOX|nr:potassium channel subfamily K member 17-like [Acipenser oxyrinchus oxyrinchus]
MVYLKFQIPTTVVLSLIYVVYVLAGGAIFWYLEGNQLEENSRIFDRKKVELLEQFSCIEQHALENFAQQIIWAYKSGVVFRGNRTLHGFWQFSTSAVFSATVVTTIGYGDISPTTTSGQLFCVLFALFGIPLNVVVLNRFGKFMLSIEQRTSAYFGQKINRRKTARVVIAGISFLIGMTMFIFIPTYAFHTFENWNYQEAFYFTFITLATIGFGDYVAGNNPDIIYPFWYSQVVAVWIFFGLAWLSLVINLCIEMLEKLGTYFKQRQLDSLENKTIEETVEEPGPVEPGEETSA